MGLISLNSALLWLLAGGFIWVSNSSSAKGGDWVEIRSSRCILQHLQSDFMILRWSGWGHTAWWPMAEWEPHLLSPVLFHYSKRRFHLKKCVNVNSFFSSIWIAVKTLQQGSIVQWKKYKFWNQWDLGFDLGPLSAPWPWSGYLTPLSLSVVVCKTRVYDTCLTGLPIRLKLWL